MYYKLYKQNFELPYFCFVEINEGGAVAIRVQRTINTTMSIAQNPVMGKMAKSFANVNTYVHRGQNVVSAKAFNRKDKNSEAQQAHRAGFKLISDIYRSIGGFIDIGLPIRPERLSPYNYFIALNLPGAIDNSGEVPKMDYSLLQISKGSLPGINVNTATLNSDGVMLQCDSCLGYGKSSVADDVITVLCKLKTGAFYSTTQQRGTEAECTVNLPIPGVSHDNVEFIYAFVLSADGKKASNSVHVRLTMPHI